MSTRRYLGILVLIQTACMACGLAFHYFYVNSAVRHQVETRTFSTLIEHAKQLAHRIDQTAVESTLKRSDLARIQALLSNEAQTTHEHVLLVDHQGMVLMDPREPAAEARSITWAKATAAWDTWEAPIRGLIQEDAGTQAAVAYPLSRQKAYLVLSATIGEQPTRLAELLPLMQTAGGLALMWTTGLCCAALFLLVTHIGCQKARPAEPDVESLKSSQALMRTQETVIFGLAKLSDSRDPDTGDHLERISYYSSTLAAALRQHPEFHHEITPTFIRLIGISSALHDIGKVGVEDAILKKPGPLTLEERALMTQHTRIGEDCLREIERRLGTSNFLQMAREIAASHHERWDGAGYPQGMAAEQIPLSARIVAIADVYDALSSKRVYKSPLPHDECVSTIAAEAGKHFDPRLVEVFLEIEGSYRNISRQFRPDIVVDAAAPEPSAEPSCQSATDST